MPGLIIPCRPRSPSRRRPAMGRSLTLDIRLPGAGSERDPGAGERPGEWRARPAPSAGPLQRRLIRRHGGTERQWPSAAVSHHQLTSAGPDHTTSVGPAPSGPSDLQAPGRAQRSKSKARAFRSRLPVQRQIGRSKSNANHRGRFGINSRQKCGG